MRPGQMPRPEGDPHSHFSKRELLEASGLSPKTFDTIRKAARVRGPGHGGMDWAFSVEDVRALIYKASGGSFSERGGPAVTAWTLLLEERGFRAVDGNPG